MVFIPERLMMMMMDDVPTQVAQLETLNPKATIHLGCLRTVTHRDRAPLARPLRLHTVMGRVSPPQAPCGSVYGGGGQWWLGAASTCCARATAIPWSSLPVLQPYPGPPYPRYSHTLVLPTRLVGPVPVPVFGPVLLMPMPSEGVMGGSGAE